jgi:hypothetical protein
VPAALFSGDGSRTRKAADWALALALPIHSHWGMNAVVR